MNKTTQGSAKPSTVNLTGFNAPKNLNVKGRQSMGHKKNTSSGGGGGTMRRGRNHYSRDKQQVVEEEVKVVERKRLVFDRSELNMHSLIGEAKDIKEIVQNEVKSPVVKRRATVQNVSAMFQPKRIEQEDWDDRQQQIKLLEESKKQRLEWRAQYHPLLEREVPQRREKSEVRKLEGDLVRVIHTEETESQIQPRLRESFWEKIGFKDKKKLERNLVEAKEKIDGCFRNLREVAQANYQDKQELEASRKRIKEQELKKAQLQKLLAKKKQQLIHQEEQIIQAQEAQAALAEANESLLLDANTRLHQATSDLKQTQAKLLQEHESAMMRLEDQLSKLVRVRVVSDMEVNKNGQLHREKVQSQLLAEEESQINGQLAMSKPLVTEIMEYFNRKESEAVGEERVESLVEALQIAIEECLIAEQKFQKAAYYDANKYLPFERTQRAAYTDKVKFNH